MWHNTAETNVVLSSIVTPGTQLFVGRTCSAALRHIHWKHTTMISPYIRFEPFYFSYGENLLIRAIYSKGRVKFLEMLRTTVHNAFIEEK